MALMQPASANSLRRLLLAAREQQQREVEAKEEWDRRSEGSESGLGMQLSRIVEAAKPLLSLETVCGMFRDLEFDRSWLLSEVEKLAEARLTISNGLEDIDKKIAELQHEKIELQARLVKTSAREADIQSLLQELDGKLRVIRTESETFENKIRSIKGSIHVSRPHTDISLMLTDGSDKTLVGHSGPVASLQIDSAERVLVSGAADRTVRVWDLDSGECTRVLHGHTGWVRALHLTKTRLATGAGDGTVRLWDMDEGICTRVLEGHVAGVTSVQFDGATLVSGSADATVRVWDLEHGQPRFQLKEHSAWVSCVQFWDFALATSSGDRTIRMWDLRNGRCHRTLSEHSGAVTCFQFDTYGLITGSSDCTVKKWDMRMGRPVSSTNVHSPVNDVVFDSRRIVCAPSDKHVKVYNAEMTELSRSMSGHTGAVRCIDLSEDLLATGSTDSTIKIWTL